MCFESVNRLREGSSGSITDSLCVMLRKTVCCLDASQVFCCCANLRYCYHYYSPPPPSPPLHHDVQGFNLLACSEAVLI